VVTDLTSRASLVIPGTQDNGGITRSSPSGSQKTQASIPSKRDPTMNEERTSSLTRPSLAAIRPVGRPTGHCSATSPVAASATGAEPTSGSTTGSTDTSAGESATADARAGPGVGAANARGKAVEAVGSEDGGMGVRWPGTFVCTLSALFRDDYAVSFDKGLGTHARGFARHRRERRRATFAIEEWQHRRRWVYKSMGIVTRSE